MNEQEDFVNALAAYVDAEIRHSGMTADYNNEAVEVLDARNHLFRAVGCRVTDEAENVYALRDLCRVDEDTLEYKVDKGRLRSVARNFGLNG